MDSTFPLNFPIVRYADQLSNRCRCLNYWIGRNSTEPFMFELGRRWPHLEEYVPGGIVDSAGQHFRVLGLRNWQPLPRYLVPLDWFLLVSVIRYCEFDPILDGPFPIELKEFKKILSRLVDHDNRLPTTARAAFQNNIVWNAPDFATAIAVFFGTTVESIVAHGVEVETE